MTIEDYFRRDDVGFQEVEGDLLSVGNDYVIAHCISRDCRLGKGIAKEIDDMFHVRSTLWRIGFNHSRSRVQVVEAPIGGGKSILIANMVTKDVYFQKPTYDSLREALEELRVVMDRLRLRKLAMPRIGCGLDGLEWPEVREIILEVFRGSFFDIRVYHLPQPK